MQKAFIILLFISFSILGLSQNEIYINDAYFDRFFRKVIIDAPPADKGTKDLAELYGQRDKTGIEGYLLQKKYPGFAVITEQKWKKRFNWNYGYMLYKRSIDSLPGNDMYGHLLSGGLSLYTKYIKIYTGLYFRYGTNPIYVETQDSSYWKKNGTAGINPFLYFDFPFKKAAISGNAVPDKDFKSLIRSSLKFLLSFTRVKQEMYADRIKTYYGFDYDGGYDIRYVFKDPMGSKSDGFYTKLRVGKSFSVNEKIGQSLSSQISNNDNSYIQLESAFWYVLGVNYHKTVGWGWRAGIDFKVDRIRFAFTYQDKYVMPTAFGNRPEKNMWWLSILMN